MDDAKLRAELIRDEGMRLLAYKDTTGLWTIGCGHLLGISQRMTEISDTEAQALLTSDIDRAKYVALLFVPILNELEDARARALVNMSFNLGSRFGKFENFLRAVNRKDWPTAADEMLNSLWAKQVKDRATRLHEMILTGEDVA